jgi:ABC-2 type transport system ATP-binding protein
MNRPAIEIQELVKRYPGDVMALDGVDLAVQPGEIFGFLGPNGAGKSTLVRILATLGLPTSGAARVGGYDVRSQAAEVRRIAGVALQDVGLDPLMKPMELLSLQGRLFGLGREAAQRRAQELLALVRLEEAADRPVETYSGGMKRRLDLAMALVHQPGVLFLDEPTTGLDPAGRRDVWAEVRRLRAELGMTIFLTTQYLEEADELADRIAIIDAGRIKTSGPPAQLKAALGAESLNLSFADRDQAGRAGEILANMADRSQLDRDTLRLYRPGVAEAIPAIIQRLDAFHLKPISITLTQPSLDDVFLQVTGESLEAALLPAAALEESI